MAELIPSPAHRRGEGLTGSFHGKPWLKLRVNSGKFTPSERSESRGLPFVVRAARHDNPERNLAKRIKVARDVQRLEGEERDR